MKRQAGFTLIELVMVIVILGILSAFALPRFADLGAEARAASINGVAGAIRSAASIAHADYLVAGTNPGTVDLEGATITMVLGYPQVAATAVASGTGDILEAAQVNTADFSISVTGNEITVAATGAAGTCEVTYEEPAAAGDAPTIEVDTTTGGGC